MKADISQIYLSNGASDEVFTLLQMLISGPKDGILIPIPSSLYIPHLLEYLEELKYHIISMKKRFEPGCQRFKRQL